MNWLLYLTLGLDRDEPFASYLPDCDVPHVSKDLPAVAVADPTEFRKENPTVFLIEFKSLREAKAIVLPLLLEPRRSYELIWMDLAGLQLLERSKCRFHASSKFFSDCCSACDGASFNQDVSGSFFHRAISSQSSE
jgi:hypothetical protein